MEEFKRKQEEIQFKYFKEQKQFEKDLPREGSEEKEGKGKKDKTGPMALARPSQMVNENLKPPRRPPTFS